MLRHLHRSFVSSIVRPTRTLAPFSSVNSFKATAQLRGFRSATPAWQGFARVQHTAPSFTADAVENGTFTSVSLEDYSNKWLLLFFYPLDFTFVCPTEIIEFSERAEEFHKLGCQVIGCSVDSKHSHLAWINQPRRQGGLGEMKIPLLSDITKQISADYGVLIEEGPDEGLSLRGTFLIDPNGIIRHISINDLPVGRNVDEYLRLLEAFQFNEKYGEVCPANWTKGAKTMVDDPKESKKYFEAVYSETK